MRGRSWSALVAAAFLGCRFNPCQAAVDHKVATSSARTSIGLQQRAARIMSLIEESPEAEWPEAWYIPEKVEDQVKENRLEPNEPVGAEELRKLGIRFWKLDPKADEYPVKSVPWDPKDASDPKLQAIRDDRGYGYADIITVHPDHLPEFEKKVSMFFEEHIHDAEEIRYILGGSGFFDVRNLKDEWVRVHVKAGDLMILPEGIYHRFTVDEQRVTHVMRLFKGEPIWTPFNRPQEDHASRQKYVSEYLAETNKEEKTDEL